MHLTFRPVACLVVGCASLSPALAATDQAKPVIAILPVSLSGNEQVQANPEAINAMVSRCLEESGLFSVVERERLGDLLKEAKFQNSGLVKDETAVELGKQAGARYVVLVACAGNTASSEEVSKTITGLNLFSTSMNILATALGGAAQQPQQPTQPQQATVVTHTVWKTAYSLDVRIVDVETGIVKQRLTSKGEGKAKNSAESVTQAFTVLEEGLRQNVIEAYPLMGRIIEVKSPKRLLVDVGSKGGVRVKDKFVLATKAPDRIHPVTGASIPGEKIILAQYVADSVDPDSSVLARRGSGPDPVLPSFFVERTGSGAVKKTAVDAGRGDESHPYGKFDVSIGFSRFKCPDYRSYGVNTVNGWYSSEFQERSAPDTFNGMVLGLGYNLVHFEASDMVLIASYMYPKKSKMKYYYEDYDPDELNDKYGYFGIGARFVWHKAIDLGASLEVRSEKMELEIPDGTRTQTVTRPWIGGSATYFFSLASTVKPYVRIGASLPLTRPSSPDPHYIMNTGDTDESYQNAIVKCLVPKLQIALEAGICF